MAARPRIIYRTENFVERVKEITGAGVPVVYDSVGKDTFLDSSTACAPRAHGELRQRLRSRAPVRPGPAGPEGLALLHAADPGHPYRQARGSRGHLPGPLRHRPLGQGEDRRQPRYALTDAAQAHRDLEGRKTTGAGILIP